MTIGAGRNTGFLRITRAWAKAWLLAFAALCLTFGLALMAVSRLNTLLFRAAASRTGSRLKSVVTKGLSHRLMTYMTIGRGHLATLTFRTDARAATALRAAVGTFLIDAIVTIQSG